jgi:hypothetical protein
VGSITITIRSNFDRAPDLSELTRSRNRNPARNGARNRKFPCLLDSFVGLPRIVSTNSKGNTVEKEFPID